jgi:hypothetical protein
MVSDTMATSKAVAHASPIFKTTIGKNPNPLSSIRGTTRLPSVGSIG